MLRVANQAAQTAVREDLDELKREAEEELRLATEERDARIRKAR